MGNKVTDELISSIRSVLSQEFSDVDIIRALHLANNDITAAINIIFDTPRSSPRGSTLRRKNSAAEPSSEASVVLSSDSPRRNGKDENQRLSLESGNPADDEVVVLEAQSKPSTSTESDWWLVGSSELSGLSTCKGRRLKAGGVIFTFPSEKRSGTCLNFHRGSGLHLLLPKLCVSLQGFRRVAGIDNEKSSLIPVRKLEKNPCEKT